MWEKSPNESEHVTEGGGLLAVSGLLEQQGEMPIRMQRWPKECHENR
jgi:hypothetical protein